MIASRWLFSGRCPQRLENSSLQASPIHGGLLDGGLLSGGVGLRDETSSAFPSLRGAIAESTSASFTSQIVLRLYRRTFTLSRPPQPFDGAGPV